MGMFHAVCACGSPYVWFSHNEDTLARSGMCDECWKKAGIREFRGPTRWLSNFHECPVLFEGVIYPTSEHAYQAAKSQDSTVRESIRQLKTAKEAKKEGAKIPHAPDWFDRSLSVMKTVVREKFFSNIELGTRLLDTGYCYLEEGNNWNDKFWGCVDGEGENHLGKILMEVRTELREARRPPQDPPKVIYPRRRDSTLI